MNGASTEFAEAFVARELPAVGRQLYAAVWGSPIGHVLIGAPTEEALRLQWLRITGKALDLDVIQRVSVVHARAEDIEGGAAG